MTVFKCPYCKINIHQPLIDEAIGLAEDVVGMALEVVQLYPELVNRAQMFLKAVEEQAILE